MPIPILFSYVAQHTINKAGGYITCVPALTHQSRLYVIHNALAAGRPYHIGTANDVQSRFTERLKAIREFGFRNNEIANVSIAIVQIHVNGLPRPPHNTGISGGIDVEQLLIRIYINQGFNVRNIAKTAPTANNYGARLDCTFVNTTGWAHFVPANVNINNGAAY